jgi:hypothetical protein
MTTKADILRAIRQKCLDCSCHQPSEVRDCRITGCSLWPFRLGSDPSPGAPRGCAKQPLPRGESGDKQGESHPTHPDQVRASDLPLPRGGFAKRDGYTGGLPDSAIPGTPTAPLPHHSQNPSSTRAVLEDGMLYPPLARSAA